MAVVQCDTCGSDVRKVPAATFAHNFCSRVCYGKWRKGKLFSLPPRNDVRGSKNPQFKTGANSAIKKNCAECGVLFIGRVKGPYCSLSCMSKARQRKRWNGPDAEKWRARYSAMSSGRNNRNWRDGRAKTNYGPGWTANLRKKIRARDGNACVVCRSTKGLQVHHRNESKTDHGEENLITLCQRCHVRVHRGKLSLLL